jgi:hypothetical protein
MPSKEALLEAVVLEKFVSFVADRDLDNAGPRASDGS